MSVNIRTHIFMLSHVDIKLTLVVVSFAAGFTCMFSTFSHAVPFIHMNPERPPGLILGIAYFTL